MKILKGFSLRKIAGENIVVPLGVKNVSFKGIITLNDSGVFLWEHLQADTNEDELLQAMLEEYEIDSVTAKADIDKFITVLKNAEVLE